MKYVILKLLLDDNDNIVKINNIDKYCNNKLTQKEKEIMKLIISGKSNKDIASYLSISEITVKSHLKNIYFKIGAKNRTHAAYIILQHGI